MALVGHCYIQPSSSDPGAVGFGYSWWQTDKGLGFERNLANSAWVNAGSADKNLRGFASRLGANFCGPISGVTGIVPTDSSSPFTVTPNVNGDRVALASDITDAVNELNTIIQNLTGVTSTTPTTSITGNLLRWSGSLTAGATWDTPLVIPITTATYADGSEVQAADCIPFVWPSDAASDDVIQNIHLNFLGANPMQYQCYILSTTNGTKFPAGIGYSVIAIKQGA